MRRAGPIAAIAFGLAGCAIASDASPPAQVSGSPWAIERQVERCRQNQSGGTRTSSASAGGLMIAGSVTAFSRTETEATEACPAVLALTDEDIGEIRTLVQATGASARGLDTNWQSRTGARREITLSVYPETGRSGTACRVVAATLTVFHGLRGATLGAPPPAPLDEQRLCLGQSGAWDPS
ncbi:hypothetical protein E8L99_21185 [Phreatobacter aquaticus]|uniref:Lipoprotein n=1 Tax=Phreatobacter aquaticus TaxID=2570229 RepID=A0A4D7QNM7_9HYPH|nr:hypothetical protein [Phreatobacter aquaticus]QCK88091.1 hypothetical protein E8L99_21185 [Phreatobacter aquaticus]